MELAVELYSLCRMCAKPFKGSVNLFETTDESSPTLSEMIETYLQIQVHVDDGLPLRACLRCRNRLLATVRLCEETKKAQEELRSRFDSLNLLEQQKSFDAVVLVYTEESQGKKEDEVTKDSTLLEEEVQLYENVINNTEVANDNPLTTIITNPNIEVSSTCNNEAEKLDYTQTSSSETKCTDKNIEDNINNKPYICEVCAKRFLRHYQLVIHNRSHTGERPYMCKLCPKRFAISSHLIRHMCVHTGVRPFTCHVCHKSFSQSCILKEHMVIHRPIEERPCYQCPYCPKTCSQKSSLKVHIYTHSQERRFECTLCSRRFITKFQLQSHATVHTGEKPFVCEYCAKCFRQRSSLYQHLFVHTATSKQRSSKRLVSCGFCEKKLCGQSSLKRHIFRIHSSSQNDEINN